MTFSGVFGTQVTSEMIEQTLTDKNLEGTSNLNIRHSSYVSSLGIGTSALEDSSGAGDTAVGVRKIKPLARML